VFPKTPRVLENPEGLHTGVLIDAAPEFTGHVGEIKSV
tara:strand:+ start:143 stop:256 length:114 start_codon:yes stop_codon:yes gene_type:complete